MVRRMTAEDLDRIADVRSADGSPHPVYESALRRGHEIAVAIRKRVEQREAQAEGADPSTSHAE